MSNPNRRNSPLSKASVVILGIFFISLFILLNLRFNGNLSDSGSFFFFMLLTGSAAIYALLQISWAWLLRRWVLQVVLIAGAVFLLAIGGYFASDAIGFTILFTIGYLGLPQLNSGPPLFFLSIIFVVQSILLLSVRGMDTHGARRKTFFAFALLVVLGAGIGVGFDLVDDRRLIVDPPPANRYLFDGISQVVIALEIGFCFLLWFCGLVVYSIPASFLSLIPLFLHYLIAAFCITMAGWNREMLAPSAWVLFAPTFAYVPLAGYLFPKHHRMVEYFRPQKLPKIPRRRVREAEV